MKFDFTKAKTDVEIEEGKLLADSHLLWRTQYDNFILEGWNLPNGKVAIIQMYDCKVGLGSHLVLIECDNTLTEEVLKYCKCTKSTQGFKEGEYYEYYQCYAFACIKKGTEIIDVKDFRSYFIEVSKEEFQKDLNTPLNDIIIAIKDPNRKRKTS